MKLKLIAWCLGITTVTTAGLMGFMYLVNLPYPMIRRPVSKVAPLLLLPSYIQMDHHYREAIAHVEQSDQLINNVSSFEDIKLGEDKVKLAQENLDKLPVSFIGYQPTRYCQMFGCSWKFTIDEFESARKKIGRMEAVIFQETNAYNAYQQAENNLQQAKDNYQQAIKLEEQQNSLKNWQNSLDELKQLPAQTFAASLASSKLNSYERDFQLVTGTITGNKKTNTIISVAKTFSSSSSNLCENPPHSVDKWQECQALLQKAINRLETISQQDIGYVEAQSLLAEYETNHSIIKLKLKREKESVIALETAKKEINNIQQKFANGVASNDYQFFVSEMQQTIEILKKVQPETTSYNEAQTLLKLAQAKLREVAKN
ncbi:MAG: hypothetical protein QNJ64_16755 [Crocosphaera sp.]|nr:hypothetical protein [Crocosphaera sp.]